MAECKNILGRILCIPSCSFVSLLRPRQKNVAITCINYYVNLYHIHCTQMIDGVGGRILINSGISEAVQCLIHF